MLLADTEAESGREIQSAAAADEIGRELGVVAVDGGTARHRLVSAGFVQKTVHARIAHADGVGILRLGFFLLRVERTNLRLIRRGIDEAGRGL